MSRFFDAIVIGAGHAGIEATRALSAIGKSVALITLDVSKVGAMSCNPAIGGVAKSHLVAEVDALGGLMGFAADCSSIQARRLNMNKGPAVRSTRLQCDKGRYVRAITSEVRSLSDVTLIGGEVVGLSVRSGLWNVRMDSDTVLTGRAAIITAGTFMRGLMFCGAERREGGRIGDRSANFLSESLCELGHRLTRLKTGTPPRLRADSIGFDALEKQWGDPELRRFSWRDPSEKLPQLCCYITHTSEGTHEIIRTNSHQSPLFSGDIVGLGPRYCPSIEDKVRRFADRSRHQIFLEPEGLDSDSIYPNGMSTSLPAEVQLSFLRTIKGLEKVEMLRAGYAVEYDTIDPTSLNSGFMSKHQAGLFLAGQINRTSGYEEAAAQGLWAGINAGLFLSEKPLVHPQRSRSYIETLADDLTSKGTNEPYRMFTSRSEYRLVLREDNAPERLFSLGESLGLLSDEHKSHFAQYMDEANKGRQYLESQRVRVSTDRVISLREYLKRPEITWENLDHEGLDGGSISDRAMERLEVEAKYDGYLVRQESEILALENLRAWLIDPTFKIETLPSISSEVIEKFRVHRPTTVLELSRISGISPVAVVMIARAAGRAPDCFT